MLPLVAVGTVVGVVGEDVCLRFLVGVFLFLFVFGLEWFSWLLSVSVVSPAVSVVSPVFFDALDFGADGFEGFFLCFLEGFVFFSSKGLVLSSCCLASLYFAIAAVHSECGLDEGRTAIAEEVERAAFGFSFSSASPFEVIPTCFLCA